MRDQVAQLERLSRLKRFFSRQVAEAIVAGGEELLEPHRREITAVFLDLRGFTAFTDRADPDEVMELLRAYHATLGRTVDEYGGTLEHFAGDGMMIFFNDPLPGRPAGRARGAHGARAAGGLHADRRGLGQARPRGGPRHRHRAGRGHARRDRLRAALGVRRDRQRAEPRRAPVRRRRAPARSCSTRRPSRTSRTSPRPSRWARSGCAAFTSPCPRSG